MFHLIEVSNVVYLLLKHAYVLCMFIEFGMNLKREKRTNLLIAFDFFAIICLLFIFDLKDWWFVILSGALAHTDFKKKKPKE